MRYYEIRFIHSDGDNSANICEKSIDRAANMVFMLMNGAGEWVTRCNFCIDGYDVSMASVETLILIKEVGA